MAKILFWLIFGLYATCEISAADNKGLPKDLKNLHVDNVKTFLIKRAPHSHVKGIKFKNYQNRCTIICPIILPPLQNCTSGYNHPIKPVTKTTTTSSTEETFPETVTTTIASSDENVSTSNEETESRNKPLKPTQIKNHLNSHQKRIILKQLRLGNHHGRKAYRYRQIGPNLCLVQCHSQDDLNNVYHQSSSVQENPDEDAYVDGEDTPIEITMAPIWPQNDVIRGIRPFGNVDFIGMDDFGPSGELARDLSVFEEKSVLKKMEKSKKSGKNLRKQSSDTNVQVKA